jgi:hypothetical protein
MFAFKPLSLALAAVTLSLGSFGSVLTPSPGEAAIVSGQFSGVWQFDLTGTNPPNFSPGDAFTAAYTYDDTQVVNSDSSVPGIVTYLIAQAPLLSLVLTSGSNSYSFNFTPGVGSGYVSGEYISLAPGGGLFYNTQQTVYGSDQIGPIQHSFKGISSAGQNNLGQTFASNYAEANTFDNDAGVDLNYPYTYNVSLSGAVPTPVATPIPTPALLPGLVGLGVAAWRKRQRAAAPVE